MKLSAITRKTTEIKLPGDSQKPAFSSHDEPGQLPIDIFENETEILILTPVAGIDLDNAEISITRDVLTIRGERKMDLSGFNFHEKEAYLKECYWGKFSRSVVLPSTVDIDKIEAVQRHYVLYIKVPKRREIQMKIVKIKSN